MAVPTVEKRKGTSDCTDIELDFRLPVEEADSQ